LTRIRIIVADDHPTFRFGLGALLKSDPELEVVAEAANGEEAVRLAESLGPDLVLMDIGMPGMSGLEATEAILGSYPEMNILILTMFEDDSVLSALRLGARGYLLKGASGEETLRAVRTVAAGGTVLSPAVARRLTQFLRTAEPASLPPPFPELSEREREILGLVAQGLSNGAIAERLYLSPKTVRNRVSEILDKLHFADRSEAIIRAREAGLVREDGGRPGH
jgi:DNA-binding NarL/FixJ family response regulator